MVVLNRTSGNGVPGAVEGQSDVSLVKLSMWEGGGVDHRLVVSKHVARAFHRHTEVAQGNAQINDLLRACT